MIFIEYPKCTTCKKAKAWLDTNNLKYTDRDIRLKTPTVSELKKWHKQSGLPLKKFFNTSGILYRELGLKDKLSHMTEDEMLELLSGDGMLIKRPILIKDKLVLLGFKEEEWKKVL